MQVLGRVGKRPAVALALLLCAADPALVPRLAGIVLGGGERIAIFADAATGQTISLHEGEAIGGYRVQSITGQGVVLAGPDGTHEVTIDAAVDRPVPVRVPITPPPATGPQNAVLAAASETGATVGRLATGRDACVVAGLLPPSVPDASTQLRGMLSAMATVRLPPGRAPAPIADGASLSASMRAGWDAAIRDGAGTLSPEECRDIDAAWRLQAVRYGFR